MSRSARIVLPGCFYHITQRGNNHQTIFNTDFDRQYYLGLFERYCVKFGVRIYAFCLMNNHVHFIASPDMVQSFAKAFSVVNLRYAQYLNQRTRKDGHVWQGRYFSKILEEKHFLSAVRYVENNPVMAGLVQQAWEWKWSSAAAHISKGESLLTLADIRPYMLESDWKNYLAG